MLSFPLPALSEGRLKSVWAVQWECSFLCQCSFLMPCWLGWAWSAMLSVIVGVTWHSLFPVSWGSLGYGFSSGLCLPWSRLYLSPVLWATGFHTWERLVCISAGWAHNYLLELSKCTDTKMTFIGVKSVLWTILHNLSKEIKIVMLKWTRRLFMSMLNHLNTAMFL